MHLSGIHTSLLMRTGVPIMVFEKHVGRHDAVVLDVGSGSGYFLQKLKERGYTNLAGIDCYHYPGNKFPIVYRDISYQPLPWADASLDAISAWEVVEHLENPYFFMREAYRALKPGGFFFLSMPNASSWESRWIFFKTGDLRRWNQKNDHITILTNAIFKKTFLELFSLVERQYCVTRFGKHGLAGRIRKKLRFLDRLIPNNEWFGSFVLYVLIKS